MAFGAQSGTIVLASTELTSGLVSKPLSGNFALADALNQMLRGTGLRFARSADGAFVIEQAKPNPKSSPKREP